MPLRANRGNLGFKVFIFSLFSFFLLAFPCGFNPGLVYAQPEEAPFTPVIDIKIKLEKNIFLDLRDINVVDVFKFLAVQGGLNIVTSKNVQGRSTLVLNRVAIQDALDILVISNQLAYEIKNNIIYIMTEDEYLQTYGKNFNDKRKVLTRYLKYAKPSYGLTALQAIQSGVGKVVIDEETGAVVMIDTNEKLMQMNSLLDEIEMKQDTKVVELQYAEAKGLETQLKPQLDAKGVGSVFADERSNQLVVSAYPDRMDQILPMVKALDKRQKAVLLEARILQLTLNPRFDTGVDWTQLFKNISESQFRRVTLESTFPIATRAASANGKLAIGKLDPDAFQVTLQAQKEVQNTKTLANPRMMILNRQAAKINIGDRLPYVVTTSTGTGTNVSVSEDIRFIDVGVILEVTPVISDNGFITMKIRPEISSQINVLTTPTNNKIPIVNKTFIDTSVIVQDGVSVVLGGLRRDELTEDNKGVPYLMNIPVLGHLFKSRSESLIKTEILIIITPKIVLGDTDILDEPVQIKKNLSLQNVKNIFSASHGEENKNKTVGDSLPARPIHHGLDLSVIRQALGMRPRARES